MALERTLVTVEYEEIKKSQCTAPDKMLFHVEIIVVVSSVSALGLLKKEEEEEENSIFDPC